MSSQWVRLVDSSGKVLIDQLDDELRRIAESKTTGAIRTSHGNLRVGFLESSLGSLYFATNDSDMLRSSRLFKSVSSAILSSILHIEKISRSIEDRSRLKNKRLIHNLTSLNGHMIQDLYSVISQDKLAGNVRRSVPLIAEEMRGKKSIDFAKCFLSFAKNSAAMKAEFSVFKKIDVDNPIIDKSHHMVHKVAMNVAYLFFSDFADKNCFINVSNTPIKAKIDYEFALVALYHLLDNAAKYIRPGTNLNVGFQDSRVGVSISFEMNSLAIKSDEVGKLIEEGYSGESSRKLGLNGDGVGMSLVQKVMNLHGGSLTISPDFSSLEIFENNDYQKNKFVLFFPN